MRENAPGYHHHDQLNLFPRILKYALGLSQLVNAGPNFFNWDVADKTKERKAKKYFVGNWRTRKNFFFVFMQITLSTSERDSWCRCCCCRNFQKFPTFSERIFPTRYENNFIWYLIKHCFTKLHKTKQARVLPKNKLNQHYISEFKKHPAHNGREVLQVKQYLQSLSTSLDKLIRALAKYHTS